MPPAAPLIVAGIAAGGAFAAGAGAFTIGSILLSGALSAVSMLMQPNRGGGGGFGQSQQGSAVDPGTKVTVAKAAATRQIIYGRARANGTIVFAHTTDNNSALHLVIALADHAVEAVEKVYFGDQLVYDNVSGIVWGGGYVAIYPHLGDVNQAADAGLMAYAPGLWTANHRLRGVTYLYVRLGWNCSLFPTGLPNIWAVVKGKKVFDPRSNLTAWSNNAALCVADYLADSLHGFGAVYGTEIDNTALGAAASVCDEAVSLRGGGTEPRYTLNGVIPTDQKPIDILPSMLGAMAGRAVWQSGKWNIQAGAWVPADFDLALDENSLRAGFSLQNLLGRRDTFNAIKGVYSSPDKLWQPDDFPSVQSSVYAAQDGGETIWKDVQLQFTTSPSAAQRLATIDIRRARQNLTLVMPCKLTAWRAVVGSVVPVTNARLGWASKPFEVTNVKLAFEQQGGEGGGGDRSVLIGVDLTLRETDSSIFDWASTDEAQFDPAPNTTFPDVLNVVPPPSLTVTEEQYVARDGGGVKVRARLNWPASIDAFADQYQPAFRLAGAFDWTVRPRVAALETAFDDMTPGAYEFGVAAVNAVGVVSAYRIQAQEITGLLAAPANPAGLTAFVVGSAAILRWFPTTDLDVAVGGAVEVRHSSLTGGADWTNSIQIIDELPGRETHCVVPARTGTFLVRFRDSSGKYSPSFASVVTALSSIGYATLSTSIEDPTFSGTKTGCTVSAGILRQTVANANALYEFAATVDLGSVKLARVVANISASVQLLSSTWDSTELCDSLDPWDEDVTGNEATSWVEERHTQTNPAGSPTWTPWQRIDSGEIEARGFQFRYQMESFDSNFYGMNTSALAVVVSE